MNLLFKYLYKTLTTDHLKNMRNQPEANALSICPDKIFFVPDKILFVPDKILFVPDKIFFVPDKIIFVLDKTFLSRTKFCPKLKSTFLLVKWMENNFLAMEKNFSTA